MSETLLEALSMDRRARGLRSLLLYGSEPIEMLATVGRAVCKSTLPTEPLLTRPMLPVSACLRAALGYA